MSINEFSSLEKCKQDVETITHFYEGIPAVVDSLAASCNEEGSFDHVGPSPVPSREMVVQIVNQARHILFPGYFSSTRLDLVSLEYYLGQETTKLFSNLASQAVLSIQHDCLRYDQACTQCKQRGHEIALEFIRALPEIRNVLSGDVRAAMEGDPASSSHDEIIFSYPGLFAIMVYRMAHKLSELEVPLIPRIMTEYAHSLTGIDIHPGAIIGKNFFIDHGTGVVIGETARIGERVRIYQGVTLGALSVPREGGDRLRNKKRHPTIEDDVIIYANATILGGETVIGARSIIGGNVWLTESVPADTKVFLKKPELVYTGNNT